MSNTSRILSATLCAAAALACDPKQDSDHDTTRTAIRAMHLSPDAPGIDVLANGEARPVITGLEFRKSSRYIEVDPGRFTFDVVPAGGSFEQRVLHVGPVELEENKLYTVVAFDNVAELRGLLLEDDVAEAVGAGFVRVRVIHAAVGVGKVDVWNLPRDGQPTHIYDNVELGTVAPYLDLPVGTYEIGLDLDDDTNPELIFPVPSLASGTVANVFAVADQTGEVNLIAQVQAGATLEMEPRQITPPGPETLARLRALHLSPDAPNVNIYADGRTTPAVADLSFGSGTGYLQIPAGARTFDIAPAGGTIADSVLRAEGIQLTAQRYYTAVAIGEVRSLQLLAMEDEPTGVPAGMIRVRAIHAAAGVGQVDLWNIPARGAPGRLYENVEFGAIGEYLVLPAGAYSIGLDANDDARPDFIFDLPALSEGTVANLFAVRDSAGAVYLLAQTAEGLAKIESRDLTPARVRVIHLSPDAPAVSVYVNEADTAAVDDLAFRSGTGYLEVPNGSYSFDVAPARSTLGDSVLSVDNVALAPERAYTVAAIGAVANLSALLLEDNFSPVPAGMIRVRAVHAAAGVGRVNILNVPSAGPSSTLYSALDFGVAAPYLEVPAGAYRLGIDVNNDHHADLLFSAPELAAGAVVNLFASADNAGTVEIVAQLNDGTVARIPAN